MPRKYVTKQKTYSDLMLQETLSKVKNGDLSYREAEIKCKLVNHSYAGKFTILTLVSKEGTVLSKDADEDLGNKQDTSDSFIIYHFYNVLEKAVDSLNSDIRPGQLWNLDETSFSTDPTRIEVVMGKGQKIHRIIKRSKKENKTEMVCLSAEGTLFLERH
ncbi:unnamed protein product [Euphydryas editha]|uniref:Uncharacterized protein n=1 Tax=Euphydryas editha TaxID=104508 RepID=A0AAU9TWW6_EUPED|nr:unnamed protein product [Euphydryas editha]